MTLLNSKFNVTTKEPLAGHTAGIWESLVPEEIRVAKSVGSGPGVPDSAGTTQLGTVPAGRIMELTALFTLQDGNSPDVTANFEKMFWCVVEPDSDYSGAESGKMVCVHGGVRIETTEYAVGGTYTPGIPLVVVAGQLSPKALPNDNIQKVGWVASGLNTTDNVLDAYLVQG
jgi:hypothetical protein